jgi:hypothetical protein
MPAAVAGEDMHGWRRRRRGCRLVVVRETIQVNPPRYAVAQPTRTKSLPPSKNHAFQGRKKERKKERKKDFIHRHQFIKKEVEIFTNFNRKFQPINPQRKIELPEQKRQENCTVFFLVFFFFTATKASHK